MAPTRTAVVTGNDRYMPSPVFVGLVSALIAIGVVMWRGNDLGGLATFVFVVVGWVVSLCLHEFGHALVAFIGGDRSVADKGYLTLDVRHYADTQTSLIFPLVILVIGGIGLPGGAVWINRGAIRSQVTQSLMSAAGPIASALCAVLCLAPIGFGWVDPFERTGFAAALGFLGLIQVIAVLFNLIPIPGLDGFGIIEPHLSRKTLASLLPVRRYGMMVLIAAIFFVPTVGDTFWNATFWLSEALAGDLIEELHSIGWSEFRFWERG